MNSVFLFCCFYMPFLFILKTVEKPPCKNGIYFSWFPLAVFATLDWKVKVSISSDLSADGWGITTWTLRAGQASHLSSCELSPVLSEFSAPKSKGVSVTPSAATGMLRLVRAVIRKLWNGRVGTESRLLAFWFLVFMLLFKHCGPFTSTQLVNLGTWAGVSKLMTADSSAVRVQADFTWVSQIYISTPSKCLEKNRTFPVMRTNISVLSSVEMYGLSPALLLNSSGICCVVTRPEI